MNKPICFCCEDMKQHIECSKIIHYSNIFDEYGIILPEDNLSFILIHRCPWCGKQLPDSKRMAWFEQLEALGYENPLLRDDIPEAYRSAEWYT